MKPELLGNGEEMLPELLGNGEEMLPVLLGRTDDGLEENDDETSELDELEPGGVGVRVTVTVTVVGGRLE